MSLQELQQFYDLHLQINEHKQPLPAIIMVANKIDIVVRTFQRLFGTFFVNSLVSSQEDEPRKRQVSAEQGREMAKLYNAKYIEASAKNGTGVDEAFTTFVRYVLDCCIVKCPAFHIYKTFQCTER